ncbi:toxin-antitoxin (TA) system antitoxin [bacterium]|nr:toxin-antitoxin (TA) system antitoxin [bacterium]
MAQVTYDISELPARYAEAVARAEQGDEVIVTAPGQRPVRLLPGPPPPSNTPRVANLHPGAMTMSPDFDDPLPDEFWLGGR